MERATGDTNVTENLVVSYDDKMFMAQGRRVRHKYGHHRPKRNSACERCGVKRRYRSSDWEYQLPGEKSWRVSNPPCVPRKAPSTIEEAVKFGTLAIAPAEIIGVARPGLLLRLSEKIARDESSYQLGTLWVWSRKPTEHYLLQATHRKHVHCVHGVFWHQVIATSLRALIVGNGTPELAVYTMLREAGIIPLPSWQGAAR